MNNQISRRKALKNIGLGIGAGIVAGHLPRAVWAQGRGPIRLGLISPLSGSQEIIGRYQLAGATIAVEQINKAGGVGGRMLELVARDDKAAPAVGLAAAKELIGAGVNLLFGVLSSGVALALAPTLKADKAVLVLAAASANELTHEQFSPNLFRITDQSYMRQRALAKLVAEDYPNVLSWTGIMPQTAISTSIWNSFADGLREYYPKVAGKKPVIADPMWVKFGATDYKNDITQLMKVKSEGLLIGVYGGDAVTLFRQAEAFNLTAKFKVMCDPGSEFIIAQAMGKSTPSGLWSAFHWYFGAYRGNKMNDALYDAYVAKTGDKYPAGYVGETHAAVYAYAGAIQRAGGSTDTDKIIAALEGLTFESAKGRRTIRKEDHQVICDVNFVQFGPDNTDQGWKVTKHKIIKGADVIEPPTPGKPVQYLNKA